MTLRNWNIEKYLAEQMCDNCQSGKMLTLTGDGFILCSTCADNEAVRFTYERT